VDAGAVALAYHHFTAARRCRYVPRCGPQQAAPQPIQPCTPNPTATRSAVSYLAEAEDAYSAGKLADASAAYARAVEMEPGNGEAIARQAWLMILRGHPPAITLAQQAVALNPSA